MSFDNNSSTTTNRRGRCFVYWLWHRQAGKPLQKRHIRVFEVGIMSNLTREKFFAKCYNWIAMAIWAGIGYISTPDSSYFWSSLRMPVRANWLYVMDGGRIEICNGFAHFKTRRPNEKNEEPKDRRRGDERVSFMNWIGHIFEEKLFAGKI